MNTRTFSSQSYYSNVSQFSPLDVTLNRQVVNVRATSGQLCFTKTNDLSESGLGDNWQSEKMHNDKIEMCVHCRENSDALGAFTDMAAFTTSLRDKVNFRTLCGA